VLVTVHPAPRIDLGADTSICNGDSKTLNAGAGFTQYLWNTAATSQQIVAATAGQFSVIATDVNGCRAKDTLSILAVHPTPLVSLSNDTLLCSGTAMMLDAGAGQQSYLWQDGSSNQTLSVTAIGTYWVRVTSFNNCFASDTAQVKRMVPAPAGFIISDTGICRAATTILQPNQAFANYLWSTGETANSITVSLPGNYWLEVINSNGCKARESIVVKTKDCVNRIFFPNAFTPNADGRNDIFKSNVSGVLANYYLAVYNRYGQLVFSTKDFTEGWSGLFKGREQNTGSFTWYSTYQFLNESPASQKGTILLIR
jgi:gliding motility-associated-like protein